MHWILLLFFLTVFQWYGFQAVRTVTQNKIIIGTYLALTIVILGNIFWQFIAFDRTQGLSQTINYSIGLFLTLLVFQLVVTGSLFLEDISRLFRTVYSFFTQTRGDRSFSFERRKTVSQIALALAAIPLSSMLYGMVKGKYNYKVLKYELEYDDLPEAFDGFTITQISDIHSGSFDNTEKVKHGIELINKQKSDLILFTGDLVNNKAEEIVPWVKDFSQLKAPYGKYSVLGNHDYGDYADWESERAKHDNLLALFEAQKQIGFDLLLNESRYIEKDGAKIALIGVENWGKGRFKKAGDLKRAVTEVKTEDFKILMSHDPSHWEAEILPHEFPFHLTLSGHTHGMQFGVEIPGQFKWSPAQWQYKQWAGIYEVGQQRINVNRGFGFLAFPGRVGIWPEISVITLKSSKSAI